MRCALRRRCLRVDRVVVAALDAGMILVARNQEKGVVVVIDVGRLDGNLSTVIDLIRFLDLQVGIGRQESVQVHRGSAVLPQVLRIPVADDLPGSVN